jgi:hypothetical protein
MSSVANTAIVDALLWDVPRLRRSAVPGARVFLDAMHLQVSPSSLQSAAEDDPLGRAGRALAHELSGQTDQAHSGYEQLTQSDGPQRLLGLFLLAWSSTQDDPLILQQALAQIREIADPILRARLCSKLVAAALSHHWDDDLEELVRLAVEWAPPEGELSYALRIEAYNLGVETISPDSRYDGEPDPLVRYDWITDLAAQSDAKRLTDEVIARARSPWTFTFTIGQSQTNRSLAAYVQAEWAGALWFLRDLRRRLAVQLLLDPSSRPRQLADAVASWVIAGGTSVDDVVELAEPGFSDDSADEILNEVVRKGPLRRRLDWPASELMLSVWDLVSIDRAVELLERFPLGGEHPVIAQRSAAFWSLMSLRVPGWDRRFLGLDKAKHRALLSGLTAAVIERLSPEVVQTLAASGPSPAEMNSVAWALVAHRSGRNQDAHLDSASASVIAQLAPSAPGLVASQTGRAVDELLHSAQRELEDARAGSAGFGGPDSFRLLALAAIRADSERLQRATSGLVEASVSNDLPADVRFQALRGLTIIAHYRSLDPGSVEELERASLIGGQALLTPTSPALIEVARLTLLAAAGQQLTSEAMALIRDENAQVRDLAVEASSLMLRNQPSEILESAVASALFDPDRQIVGRALRHFGERSPQSKNIRPAVARRIVVLFETGGRDIRAAAISAVNAGVLGPDGKDESRRLLDAAQADRSFLVRDAVRIRNNADHRD